MIFATEMAPMMFNPAGIYLVGGWRRASRVVGFQKPVREAAGRLSRLRLRGLAPKRVRENVTCLQALRGTWLPMWSLREDESGRNIRRAARAMGAHVNMGPRARAW